jgi:hypothetical protein
MNKILSAKIWWRWMKRPQDLWAKLWRRKYTPNTTGKKPDQMEQRQPRLPNLDDNQEESTTCNQSRLLGNPKWSNNPLLEGFMATVTYFRARGLG